MGGCLGGGAWIMGKIAQGRKCFKTFLVNKNLGQHFPFYSHILTTEPVKVNNTGVIARKCG